jgi:hypothetical protein
MFLISETDFARNLLFDGEWTETRDLGSGIQYTRRSRESACTRGGIDAHEDGSYTREVVKVDIAEVQLSAMRCEGEIREEGDRCRVLGGGEAVTEDGQVRPVEPSPVGDCARGRVHDLVENPNLLGFNLSAIALRQGRLLLRQGRFFQGEQPKAQNGRHDRNVSCVHRDLPCVAGFTAACKLAWSSG